MEGTFGVSTRREPSYFDATLIQGETARIIKVKDEKSGQIVSFGGVFTLNASMNGQVEKIGYLADLRIEPDYRNGQILARAFKYIREIHLIQPVPFYTTMILEGNEKALKSLTSSRAGLPVYHPLGRILTPAIHLDIPKPALPLSGIEIVKGCTGKEREVFAFINRTRAEKQFAPIYTEKDIGSARLSGLRPEDFYLALQGNELVGVIAAWDQGSCRQTYLERYPPSLAMTRPLYNLLTWFTPLRKLPEEGTAIPYFYVSLVAVKDNDLPIFRTLLRAMYRDRRKAQWHYFICGLHESDPLAEALEDYRKIGGAGRLYCVYYPELGNPVDRLESRIPYMEIAAL